MKRLLVPVIFATAGAAMVPTLRGQAAPYSVPDSEISDPPTRVRLQDMERAADASDWVGVAVAARSAGVRAYQAGRLQAADGWYNAYRWMELYSEPQDRFINNWNTALQAFKLAYPGLTEVDAPIKAPLGNYLSGETRDWLLTNPAFSEEFFANLTAVDYVPRVFSILDGLRRRDPERFSQYSSLALAFALVDDVAPPPYWPHNQVTPEALPRRLRNPAELYDYLTHEDQLGHTYFNLRRLRTEELKFVVDAAAPVPELRWAEGAVPYSLGNFVGAYTMIGYREDRAQAESQMTWSGTPYTLQAIKAQGGICCDQAYFATEAGKARGVPTLLFSGSGRDGRHAWFGYLGPDGKWQLDAARIGDEKFVTGVALNPQTWLPITDHELKFLAERFRALPSFMQSRVHEEFAEEFLRSGEFQAAAEAARMATNFEGRNLPAWQTLVAADENLGVSPANLEGVYREAERAFEKYPGLAVTFGNLVIRSLRDRGQMSQASYEERSMAERFQGERSDLAVKQAGAILERSVRTQPLDQQIQTYNAILAQFGQGSGITFFDEIVVGFAEHLAQVNHRAEARQAVERAREVLGVQPGTMIATEMDRLMDRLQD